MIEIVCQNFESQSAFVNSALRTKGQKDLRLYNFSHKFNFIKNLPHNVCEDYLILSLYLRNRGFMPSSRARIATIYNRMHKKVTPFIMYGKKGITEFKA